MTAPSLRLDRKKAVVVVVDVQSRLTPAMPQEALARVLPHGLQQVIANGAGLLTRHDPHQRFVDEVRQQGVAVQALQDYYAEIAAGS